MEPTLYLNKPVVGITGSFGKTTVKEITAEVLSVKFDTFRSNKNFNMVDQTRKHVKQINDDHEAVVMEMAMAKKGRGKGQCTVIQPNIGVITAVGHAHFERFSSIYDTVLSKSEMMKYMNPDGTLYLNYDDEYSKLIDTKYFTGNIVTVGLSEEADYTAKNLRFNKYGMEFGVELNGKIESMFLPMLGEHSVVNALFAISIADKLGLTAEEIRLGLEKVKVQRGRLTLDHLKGNRLLLDDSGNANPASMMAGLKVLNNYLDSRQKIAVLGDMAELGSYTREGHEKVGKFIKDFEIDNVYLYGKSSKWILNGAEKVGFPKEKLHHFNDLNELITEVDKQFTENTAVLVKASKATKLKEVVKYLLDRYQA